MSHPNTIEEGFIKETLKRLCDESPSRIHKCLDELTEDEIWFRPNDQTVSVGNLILHLCGNVRQYIISGIGEVKDVRVRDEEFNEKGPLPTEDLRTKLNETISGTRAVLENLKKDDFTKATCIQGFTHTGVEHILNVTQHFAYHTGQITYFVKSKRAIDMKYCANMNLNVINETPAT